jgi:hypothetical protein
MLEEAGVASARARLDLECLDRIYLNAYVPIRQPSSHVVASITQHLDLPDPFTHALRQDRAEVPPRGRPRH